MFTPQSNKVRALINMPPPPTNLKQFLSFLVGFAVLVTYYRDTMFPRRSHVLCPLTDLIGTGPLVWFPIHRYCRF